MHDSQAGREGVEPDGSNTVPKKQGGAPASLLETLFVLKRLVSDANLHRASSGLARAGALRMAIQATGNEFTPEPV